MILESAACVNAWGVYSENTLRCLYRHRCWARSPDRCPDAAAVWRPCRTERGAVGARQGGLVLSKQENMLSALPRPYAEVLPWWRWVETPPVGRGFVLRLSPKRLPTDALCGGGLETLPNGEDYVSTGVAGPKAQPPAPTAPGSGRRRTVAQARRPAAVAAGYRAGLRPSCRRSAAAWLPHPPHRRFRTPDQPVPRSRAGRRRSRDPTRGAPPAGRSSAPSRSRSSSSSSAQGRRLCRSKPRRAG